MDKLFTVEVLDLGLRLALDYEVKRRETLDSFMKPWSDRRRT